MDSSSPSVRRRRDSAVLMRIGIMVKLQLLLLLASSSSLSSPQIFFVVGFVVAPPLPPSGASSIQRRRRRQDDTTTVLDATKEATFGMGCFWEPAEALLKVDGVIDTIAGYTGKPDAETAPPSYESVCYGREWVEAVRVIYDEDTVSYPELLDAMYQIQKPQLGSRQYASIIFPHDDEQERLSQAWIQQQQQQQQANVTGKRKDGFKAEWTAIEPRTKFFQAEGYHQRYWQKQRPRFAMIGVLLAVATGLLDSVIPIELQSTVETAANALTIAIGIFITLERFFDSKVVEL